MKLSEYVKKRVEESAQQAKSAEALGILGVESVPQARAMRAAVDVAVTRVTDDDDRLRISALFPEWTAGEHAAGDIYVAEGQVWECFQAYDNAVHPDVTPSGSAWGTFNRPLHGKTRETAREYIAPTGAHDVYHAGEWAVFDGRHYRCRQDTVYTPTEYAAAWEDDNG